MKRALKLRFVALVAAVLLLAGAHPRAFAADEPAHAPNVHSQYEKMDAPESNSEEEGYRHSASVQWIARHLGIETETAAKIFEDINSAIIWAGILWFVVKFVPKAFRDRSAKLQKELEEARSATEDAKKRLAEVEARLAKLDSEIDAFRKQVEQESAEDEQRIKAALEEERKRIIESAEQEIEGFGAAAQRELKRFAAELAVERVLQRIHLGADADRILVQNFTADLSGTQSKGGKN